MGKTQNFRDEINLYGVWKILVNSLTGRKGIKALAGRENSMYKSKRCKNQLLAIHTVSCCQRGWVYKKGFPIPCHFLCVFVLFFGTGIKLGTLRWNHWAKSPAPCHFLDLTNSKKNPKGSDFFINVSPHDSPGFSDEESEAQRCKVTSSVHRPVEARGGAQEWN